MDPIFTGDVYFALPEILQLIWTNATELACMVA